MSRRRKAGAGQDELPRWLADAYAPAYRTAFLFLRNRSDAEEAVQDAFLRAWRFRSALPSDEGVRPWLYRVVVNACLSKLRADRSRLTRSVAYDDAATNVTDDSDPDSPASAAEASEARSAVIDAIADLPEHLRVVVVLRYYAQLSEKEIATAIHRRSGTVKSRLHEAKLRLGADSRLAAHAGVAAFTTEVGP